MPVDHSRPSSRLRVFGALVRNGPFCSPNDSGLCGDSGIRCLWETVAEFRCRAHRSNRGKRCSRRQNATGHARGSSSDCVFDAGTDALLHPIRAGVHAHGERHIRASDSASSAEGHFGRTRRARCWWSVRRRHGRDQSISRRWLVVARHHAEKPARLRRNMRRIVRRETRARPSHSHVTVASMPRDRRLAALEPSAITH